MKIRLAIICAVALLASVASTTVPAQTRPASVVPDIKGIKLNATQADVQARFPAASCGPTSNGLVICTLANVPYGGSKAGLLSAYLDGGVVVIEIEFLDASAFDFMMRGLRTKFGPADERDPERPTWRGKSWELRALKSTGPRDRPSIRLLDTGWRERREQLRDQEAAKSLD